MKILRSLAAALLILLSLAGVASAHTGAITSDSSCGSGNVVTAHLDANVAAKAEWSVAVNGAVVDSGAGPGPRDLGPYDGGRSAGTATLTITFKQETNVYTTSLKDAPPCPTPTPSPTPRPSHTPTPRAHVTPPPTNQVNTTSDQDVAVSDLWSKSLIGVVAVIVVGFVISVYLDKRPKG